MYAEAQATARVDMPTAPHPPRMQDECKFREFSTCPRNLR